MSLIIHTIVPEGIVVCADTRTTHRDGKGHVQYDDTAEKNSTLSKSYCCKPLW